MTENLIFGLAGVIVLGVSAQWIAWRLKFPSILLLLVFGFIAGPITGLIKPDLLLGDLFFPVVSLSVAIILFEGGLSLKLTELRKTGTAVQRIVTLGALVTWVLCAIAAHYILGFEPPLAVLLGAILVVSGPTVIIPLLRHVQPTARVASLLRWEGILIDPVGAVFAVLVYEAIVAGGLLEITEITMTAILGILKTIVAGGITGAAGALAIIVFLRRFWLPDFLQNPVTLMVVVCVFAVSNVFQPESGLMAVTVMGVVLANQNIVAVRKIILFKENLRVLIIAGLFILLAARLDTGDFADLSLFKGLAFLFFLMLVVRPAAVLVSTLFTEFNWRERVFISFVSPRGIVAAAISSVFALRMMDAGYHQASQILPVTFLVIIGTVAINGLGCAYVARRLKVARPHPQGILMLGAHPWAVKIAKAVKDAGFKVVCIDTNHNNIFSARMEGIEAHYGSGLAETAVRDIDLDGIGRLFALTPNDSVNSLVILHFEEVFDRSELYQIRPYDEEKLKKEAVSKHLRGRYLFGPEINYRHLARRFSQGAVVKRTKLTEEFDYKAYLKRYGEGVSPLFLITEGGALLVFTHDNPPVPQPGQTILGIVDPVDEAGENDKGADTRPAP